jgi:hypothetical protein
MTLETLPNRLSDDSHQQQDTQAYAATLRLGVRVQDVLGISTAGILLSELVFASVGQLDSRFGQLENAVQIVDGTPDLLDLLNVAWQKREFRDVRNLRLCFLYISVANFDKVKNRLFELQL